MGGLQRHRRPQQHWCWQSGMGFDAGIALLTIGLSNTMSAGAAVAVMAPVVLKTAVVAGEDPLRVGFLTAMASAFGYLTPAAQPAFTIIFASGYLRSSDFLQDRHPHDGACLLSYCW